MKVLYVDDSPLLLDIISDIIFLTGNEPKTLCSVSDTLKEISCNEYDIILIDSKLDNNNGFEIAKTINSIINNPCTKIILFAPSVSTELRKQCIREGLGDAIRQPLGIEDFRDIFSEYSGVFTGSSFFSFYQKESLSWVA